MSVNRRHLNEVMITEAEKHDRVSFLFRHKVRGVDLKRRTLLLRTPEGLEEESRPADLVLACDGAFSAVRRGLMGFPRFDFSQVGLLEVLKELHPASGG